MDKEEARKIRNNVKRCLEVDGNNKCADCAETITIETGWASISFGVTLCVNCAGVHRSIDGNQIRSFSLDSSAWSTSTNVEFLRKIGGNIKANKNVWEHNLPTFHINPKYDIFANTKNQSTLRALFIKSKYESQLFTPDSQEKVKKHSKQKLHIKKMPIDVRQNLLYFHDRETKLFAKKPEYCVIHGQFISRYSASKIKKNKCTDTETYDLLKLKVVIEHMDDEKEFVFMLYDDNTYIPANVLKHHKMATINIRRKEHEVIRIKYKGEFNTFSKIVHDIRATISYYRMYEQLINIYNQQDEPLIIMNYDLQKANFLGIGKVFNSTKCYFFVINDTLYGLQTKKDPRTIFSTDDKCAHLNAKYGWNLNKINILLDDAGKRTGSKYALLLILKNKTIFIKYDNGPNAVKFYTNLQKLCIASKGRYMVNFTSVPPTICGEDKKDNENDEEKNKEKEAPASQQKQEKMQLLRKKSHHQKCPTQILEIISQIQIDEEINGPVIYEDIEEEQESQNEYVYEIAQPQNSVDLMSLPPDPSALLARNNSDENMNVPPPAPNNVAPPQQPPPPPMGIINQNQNQPPPPPNVSPIQQEIQQKLKAEQQRKKIQYEQEKQRLQLEQSQRAQKENQALELQKAIAEEEKMKILRELEQTKAKMAEEERKRKALEEETKRLKQQQQVDRQERERLEKENQAAAKKALAPPEINPAMQIVDKGGVVIGSPKSWEMLEKRMMNNQNIEQGLSVEEALAQKFKADNNEESSSDESSESDYSTDSDYSKRNSRVSNVNSNVNANANAAPPPPQQPYPGPPQNNANMYQQQPPPGPPGPPQPQNYGGYNPQQQQQQPPPGPPQPQNAYGYNQHQKQQASQPQNYGGYNQYAAYNQNQNQNQANMYAQQQQQQPPQAPQGNNKLNDSSEEEDDDEDNDSSEDEWEKQKNNKINNAMMNSMVQQSKDSPVAHSSHSSQPVQYFKPQQQQQQQPPPNNPIPFQNNNSYNQNQNKPGSFSQNPNVNMYNQNQNNMNKNGSFSQNPNANMYNQNKPGSFSQNPNQNMYNANVNVNAKNGSFSQNPNQNMYNQNKPGSFSQNPNINIYNQQQNKTGSFTSQNSNKSNHSGGGGGSGGGDRWTCPMCTFENKPTAKQCDMCTVDRPKPKKGFDGAMSPTELKQLHSEMTYHYNEYTKMQQLPPVKQQEMHQQMTYHYQQYSNKYKRYQQQQQKPKVVKARKSKLISGSEMQYLKLQRIFSMSQQQQQILSNVNNFNTIQQLFGQYARITVVPQNNCYQIAIPNNIPLPRRKDHWQQILQIIRSQIGVSQER